MMISSFLKKIVNVDRKIKKTVEQVKVLLPSPPSNLSQSYWKSKTYLKCAKKWFSHASLSETTIIQLVRQEATILKSQRIKKSK